MRSLTKLFKALSDTNRLRILKMLEVKLLCVCEITEALHLAIHIDNSKLVTRR
jgi:ArsR family transcriptional regulator